MEMQELEAILIFSILEEINAIKQIEETIFIGK